MQTTLFSGSIQFVSVSPHGQPEGLLLEDGSFIKVPPHTVLDPSRLTVGQRVEGAGELIAHEPNRVFHHARVTIDGQALTSGPDEDHARREQHKKQVQAVEVHATQGSVSGRLLGLGTKPKGEVDRLLLEGKISVHLPKELTLQASSFRLGEELTVTGELREFPLGVFVKAGEVHSSVSN